MDVLITNGIIRSEKHRDTYFVNGVNLRAARELTGVSLRQFAKRLDVSATYLSRLELDDGDARISEDLAKRIAKELGL